MPPHSPLLRRITVGTIQSADKTIFVSNALLDSAIDLGYAGENAVVISNLISIKRDCLEAGLTVTFTGRVPHDYICHWIILFDVLILPSRAES